MKESPARLVQLACSCDAEGNENVYVLDADGQLWDLEFTTISGKMVRQWNRINVHNPPEKRT